MLVDDNLLKGLKIAVLMGGKSNEREISLKSGKAVYQSLKDAGFVAVPIDIIEEDAGAIVADIKGLGADIAFIAMHGRFGEDGTLQEILESAAIPYTGCGPRASRLAMDKVASREVFLEHGISVPRSRVFEDELLSKINLDDLADLGFPLVVKPAAAGSSIGVSIVNNQGDLIQALESAFSHDKRIIIEEYLEGRELTVGILEEEPLPVIEIIPKIKFFNYQAKYTLGMTDYIVPAKIAGELSKKVQQVALSAYKSLGCQAFSRVDMILKNNLMPYVLEINTIPGLTKMSLLPKAAGVANISFLELCLRLISLAVSPKFIREDEKQKINF